MNTNRSTSDKARQLARHEVNWWKAHHRRQQEQLIGEMTRLYVLQFDLDYNDAKLAVQHRVMAARLHDMAESFEDADNKKEAETYWNRAEQELQVHYMLLLQLSEKEKP